MLTLCPDGHPKKDAHTVTTPRVEGHRRPQPHVQKLLGPMEIPCSKRWLTGTPLGIRQWSIKDSQVVLPRSRVDNVLAELHGGPSGGHLGVNKTLDKVRLLASGEE
jgi:hypothetical protein